MKYLSSPILDYLSNSLSDNPSPEMRAHVRFELYSVKPIREERKMFKGMEEAYVSGQEEMEEMSFSPEMKEAGLSSVFGRLDEKESRKVHFLLVSTLNAAFPDHEFSSLRPDHFTKEISSADVLNGLSKQIGPAGPSMLQLGSSPLGRSPSASPATPAQSINPDLYRALSEVVPLDECDVYSWFPEREYDPHLDPEEGEASEDEDEAGAGGASAMDIEEDGGAGGESGWGMDLDMDDVPQPTRSTPAAQTVPSARRDEARGGGLLWSANYFFYSRRQKRMLFVTAWARKRSPLSISPPDDHSAFPAPISSTSFTPPSYLAGHSSSLGVAKPRSNPMRNYTKRRSKQNLRAAAAAVGGGGPSSTIPIRGMQTPARMATSAPSAFSLSAMAAAATTSPGSAGALARMNAGGFKPRPTARGGFRDSSMTPMPVSPNQPRVLTAGAVPTPASRVRKDRSESMTPSPVVTSMMDRMSGAGPAAAAAISNSAGSPAADGVKGKRVRV